MASVREGDPASVGMMEGAFFISRRDLLNWVNTRFGLNVSKVEECSNGVVYLQIVDAIYPGKVPVNKIKWQAKQEYESIHNYKILQDTFNRLSVNKYIEVDKLIKGKYQDNLEMLQWMKAYYERTVGEDGSVESSIVRPPTTNAPPRTQKPQTRVVPSTSVPNKAVSVKATSNMKETIENLQRQLEQETIERRNAEREKEFYFRKLRELEIKCQNKKEGAISIEDITAILYAPDEVSEAESENHS